MCEEITKEMIQKAYNYQGLINKNTENFFEKIVILIRTMKNDKPFLSREDQLKRIYKGFCL